LKVQKMVFCKLDKFSNFSVGRYLNVPTSWPILPNKFTCG
jgi:hypothetical protein